MKKIYEILLVLIFFTLITTAYFYDSIQLKSIETDRFISPEIGEERLNISLFFVEDNKLEIEKRKIMTSKNSYAKDVIAELIKGGKEKDLISFFQKGVNLNSIKIIDEVCYIDLDSNENDLKFLNSKNSHLYIWSIVNTLTELKEVVSVQILFNGQKVSKVINGYNLKTPLPRLENLAENGIKYPVDIVESFIEYIYIQRYDLAYSYLTKSNQNKISFQEFKKRAQNYHDELLDLEEIFHFTKTFSDRWEIVYHYENIKGEKVNKYWNVIKENNYYKIILTESNF